MAKATCTKVKEKPIYNFVVRVRDDEVHLQADEYIAEQYEPCQLDFYIANKLIATFKAWDHVIQRDLVEMKKEVIDESIDDFLAGFSAKKKKK